MLKRATGVGILLFSLLGIPTVSEAGLFEFIWDMSGPQILNIGFGCNINARFKVQDCKSSLPIVLGSSPFTVQEKKVVDKMNEARKTPTGVSTLSAKQAYLQVMQEGEPRVLFLIGGEAGLSTGRNSGDSDYKAFHTRRLAFAPEMNVRVWGDLRAGAGISLEYFSGNDVNGNGFDSFGKFAFVLTPYEVVGRNASAAVKIRIYPDGFTSDEFMAGGHQKGDRPYETTIGVSLTFPIMKRPK